MTERIYLDHAATSPLRPELAALLLEDPWGNTGSLHAEGRRARDIVEEARDRIRRALGADGYEVVLTSGGTEADNLAVVGRALAARGGGSGQPPEVLASAVEHPAVLACAPAVERAGARLREVGVTSEGRLDLDRLESTLGERSALLSLVLVQNETGVVQPVAEALEMARSRGVPIHVDATQAIGRVPLDLSKTPFDLVSISGHKIGAPVGIGALLLKPGVELEPLSGGGGQQLGRRAGTEPVALGKTLGAAVEFAVVELEDEAPRLRAWSAALRRALASFEGVVWNTPEELAAPHILNVSFPDVEGQSLVRRLDALGVAASTGSACRASTRTASRPLIAMGRSRREARGALRVSIGRTTRPEDGPALVERLRAALADLRAMLPADARAPSRQDG